MSMSGKYFDAVLWDVPEAAKTQVPADLLIRRVLSYGGIPLIVRARRVFGEDVVKRTFASMKSTSMPARKYAYLKNFLLS